ncbi:MAG: response regulator [Acidobacteria bacterium]|nr:response regulator [Acidobacteriota bacterium]
MSYVLIVEDQAPIARLLRTWVIGEGAEAVVASSAEQALLLAAQRVPAVAMCDIRLPGGRDGFWLVAQLRTLLPDTAVVMTTGLPPDPTTTDRYAGVTDYVVKPFTRERIAEALHRALAEHDVRTAAAPDGRARGTDATTTLLAVLHATDPATERHGRRVAGLSVRLGRALGLADLDLRDLEHAALLRDVRRTDIFAIARDVPYLSAASAIAVAAGEHADGTGFPLGLKGQAIPLGARIVAVATAYCDLPGEPARRGLTPAQVVEVLCGEHRDRFDPDVLRALQAIGPALESSAA